MNIFTKFHKDWTKIAKFWAFLLFFLFTLYLFKTVFAGEFELISNNEGGGFPKDHFRDICCEFQRGINYSFGFKNLNL